MQKVRFADGAGKTVELDARKEGRDEEPRVWLKLSADAKKKKPARELPGNEGAERLWDKFAPLRATRALGVLGADKLKELGLDAPKKHLEVTARGVTHTFDVGARRSACQRSRTCKDEHDGASTCSAAACCRMSTWWLTEAISTITCPYTNCSMINI